MGLISKTVKVKWNSKSRKHYESLNYVFTKYGDEFEVKVEDLPIRSHTKVEIECDYCKEIKKWTYDAYNSYVRENGNTYCFKCGKKLYGDKKSLKTKLKKSKSFYDWCIENDREDLLLRWDYELNDCTPKDISYASSVPRWFRCATHIEHKSETKVINRITCNNQEGSMNCKQCNSIAQYILDNFPNKKLEEVWDYEKNEDLDPWNVSYGSSKKCWFKCQEKDYHESYKMCCNNFSNNHYCPLCTEEKEKSIIEEKTESYLKQLGYKVKTEHNCTIRPINPKTKQPLPFDNEIILENGKHLVIEVHGKQHYEINENSNFLKVGQTIEEYLHQRKLYDRYKRIKCIQAGYYYLELPYTVFNKKEIYKTLINNKIKEILNNK